MVRQDSKPKLREMAGLRKLMARRTLLSALSATMAFSLLTACASKEGSGSGASAAPADKGQAATASAPKEQVTLKVEVFDRGNSPAGMTVTDNLMTKWIQQNFGDKNNIKLEYVPVPRAQEVDKLNVLMASGDAPDIVFTYDGNLTYKYASQGGLTDLGKLVDQYGPDLKKYLGDATLAYGKFDNVQYAIPAKRSYLGKYSSMIRQDWLDKLGLPAPKTTDEVYNTLKAFKEKDPAGNGQTIPLGFGLFEASYEPIIYSFIKSNMTDEERFTLTQRFGSSDQPVTWPGHKDAVKFLNKLYNEGLMSPDFALDKDKKKLKQDVMTGKVGMYAEDAGGSYAAAGDTVYLNLQQNVPGAKLTPIDPYTNDQGKHAKPSYQPNGMYIMVPKSSKHAAEAVKYLNWMSQNDVMMHILYGVEGTNYNLVDGVPAIINNDNTKQLLFNPGDMEIVANGMDFGDMNKNLTAMALSAAEQYRKDAAIAYKNGLTDGIPQMPLPHPMASEVKYTKALKDKYQELLVKSIIAKPADFDKTYDAALKDYMDNGGNDIAKERKDLWQQMKK
jgi:putative aldouronate transport system substrate-binding protein